MSTQKILQFTWLSPSDPQVGLRMVVGLPEVARRTDKRRRFK